MHPKYCILNEHFFVLKKVPRINNFLRTCQYILMIYSGAY